MTEKTFEALTDEEWDMIETIRENREDGDFRLLIERKHGVLGDRAKKRESAQSGTRQRCRLQSGMGQYNRNYTLNAALVRSASGADMPRTLIRECGKL
jgi:hypothetical protein